MSDFPEAKTYISLINDKQQKTIDDKFSGKPSM